ncbi:MAG: oxidoreductase [Flavobacteriales bacterium]|nr:oxidoreductase [Flavobacteriales bacterium]|tara:strand:+ start:3173 stop:4201 length:1029 start_codon:yes stop_codon:yes gene_type:complete
MSKKVKFGIVGIGHIGTRHAQCIINNKDAVLSAVCDIRAKEEWKKSNNNIDYCSTFDDLVAQDLDVINICTPNYLHAEMALNSLNTGKHVVIEKPIALSTTDAKQIITTANQCDRIVFGVMQNRFSPTIAWLKKIIDTSLLGEINMISVNCFWNRNKNYYLNSDWHGSKEKDGGPLFTQFSHFIDIINWIFGDFYNISATFSSFRKSDYVEFEDSGIIKFNLKNKLSKNPINATLTYSTAVWNKNFESSITILGELGTIKIGGQYMDKIIYCDIKDYIMPELDTNLNCNDYGDYKGSASNHDKMISHVVQTLLESNKKGDVLDFSDGIDVVNIIERIYSLRN